MSDVYLPAACTVCERVALILASSGDATCSRCASPVAVVPGEAYCAADVPLFERIESIIHASALSSTDGDRVVRALVDVAARTRHPQRSLMMVVDAAPLLRFLKDSIKKERERLARAPGMVLTIVSARNQRRLKNGHQ
jgi:hypothetical protein